MAFEQFKKDGTGSHIEDQLLKEFPLFHGIAPPGHPYPQASTKSTATSSVSTTTWSCCAVSCRERPRHLDRHLQLCNAQWQRRHLAHLNMNNGDNRVENLKWVNEDEARKLLMDFGEGEVKHYQIVTVLPNGEEQV